MQLIFLKTYCVSSLVFSAAAKKAACSHPEPSGDKGEGEKEGINGEVEEEGNGKANEGEGDACGSKQRACRRTGESNSSGPGKELNKAPCSLLFL